MREYLNQFFAKEEHKWIHFIGDSFLHRKGLSLDEYMANIVSPGVPIDELGLMIMAKMYHAHVAVIMKDYTWTTGWNLLAKECKFIFTYTGGLSFHMVCNKVEGFTPPQKWPLNLSKHRKTQRSSSRKWKAKTELSTTSKKKLLQ